MNNVICMDESNKVFKSVESMRNHYWHFYFFKQKTAYERRSSDWSSDVCSSDLFVDGQAEATFAEQRLVVAHDPQRATEQSAKRRARIQALEDFAQTLVRKLDAPDDRTTARGRKASDHGA